MSLEELSESARARYLARLSAMSTQERMDATLQTIRLSRTFMEAGIRLRHPGADAREVQARVAAILYGPAVAFRLYGLRVDAD